MSTYLDILNRIDYERLPQEVQYIKYCIQEYIEDGKDPLDTCIEAIICNNLKEAFMFADENVEKNMKGIVAFFYTQAPSACWGSKEGMNKWIQCGGLKGLHAEYLQEIQTKGGDQDAPDKES